MKARYSKIKGSTYYSNVVATTLVIKRLWWPQAHPQQLLTYLWKQVAMGGHSEPFKRPEAYRALLRSDTGSLKLGDDSGTLGSIVQLNGVKLSKLNKLTVRVKLPR